MTALLVTLALLFAACGGDGPGNDDTLWTGFSGFVFIVIVVAFVMHYLKKRRRS